MSEPMQTPAEARVERQAAFPSLYRTAHERMCYELALRMDDPEAVFARYGYTLESGVTLVASPVCKALYDRIEGEVQQHGLSYRMKARAIAEELLTEAFDIATDPTQPAAVRADIIKWTGKVGDLEPKNTKESDGSGGGFNLTITFAGQPPSRVIDQGVLIEQVGG